MPTGEIAHSRTFDTINVYHNHMRQQNDKLRAAVWESVGRDRKFAQHGKSLTYSIEIVTRHVPEPTALALIALGALGKFKIQRRSR